MKPFKQGAWHRCGARAFEFMEIESNKPLFKHRWTIYLNTCRSRVRQFLAGDPQVPTLDVFDRIAIALSLCSEETQRKYWRLSRILLLQEFSTPAGMISPIYGRGLGEFKSLCRMVRRIRMDPEGEERLKRLFYEKRLDLADAVWVAYVTAVEDPELVQHHSKKR